MGHHAGRLQNHVYLLFIIVLAGSATLLAYTMNLLIPITVTVLIVSLVISGVLYRLDPRRAPLTLLGYLTGIPALALYLVYVNNLPQIDFTTFIALYDPHAGTRLFASVALVVVQVLLVLGQVGWPLPYWRRRMTPSMLLLGGVGLATVIVLAYTCFPWDV